MKHILSIFLIVITLGFVSCKESPQPEIKVVSPEEMKSLLEMDDVQLIDVRTAEEYDLEHIAKSQNIDIRSPDFDQEITRLDKERPVLLYCHSGKRSAECAMKLKDAGFVKIYDLSGGITKWKYSGFEVETKS
jgi:rhodanese-related sulfurtransferase